MKTDLLCGMSKLSTTILMTGVKANFVQSRKNGIRAHFACKNAKVNAYWILEGCRTQEQDRGADLCGLSSIQKQR